MAENRDRYTSYNEYRAADAMDELSPEDQELAARIEDRKKQSRRSQVRARKRRLTGIIIAMMLLLTMCSREIIRLRSENHELRKQQSALEKKRDELSEELGRAGDKDYIKEQARKQLRLLDPGEIMFIFNDDKSKADASEEENGEDAEGKAEDGENGEDAGGNE